MYSVYMHIEPTLIFDIELWNHKSFLKLQKKAQLTTKHWEFKKIFRYNLFQITWQLKFENTQIKIHLL